MFRLNTSGNLRYYTIDEFEKTGLLKHCFSTRRGGVSTGTYDSLNLRMNSGDSTENVLKNYEILCDELNMNYKNLVFSKQVHSDKIYTVGKNDCGNGIVKPQKFESCDALITAEAGVPIAVFGADCVPVYFFDTENRVIALAHSGWKGTVLKISEKVVAKMMSEFSSKPENIIAAIGPSVQVCHFEVGDEVADIFRDKFGAEVIEKHEKYHVNMQKAVKMQLEGCGVPQKNIVDSGICTYCDSELFYSHRLMGDARGVMAALMEIKEG